ncbi:MAG: DUF2007 domain-containing protein [Gemmatimonadetes bacterium]|nr:DUF2007 domain-containing protein [Gemmatimonadota bacterium]
MTDIADGDETGDAPAELRWVRLTGCANTVEAEVLRQTLDTADIPVLIRGLQPGIFGGGFQGAIPHGIDVCVPSPELERARELLSDSPE